MICKTIMQGLLTSPIVQKYSLTLKMSMDCHVISHFLLFLMANLHHNLQLISSMYTATNAVPSS